MRNLSLCVAAIVLFGHLAVEAGTPRQKAAAAVAVARVRIQMARQQPDFPSTTKSEPEIVPQRLVPEEVTVDPQIEIKRLLDANSALVDEHKRLSDETTKAIESLDETRKELESVKSSVNIPENTVPNPPEPIEEIIPLKGLPPIDSRLIQPKDTGPMRLEIIGQSDFTPIPRRKATVYTARNLYGPNWCPNCGPEKQKIGNGNSEIEVTWSDNAANGPQYYPAYRFVDSSGKEHFTAGANLEYCKPDSLEELCEIIDIANGQKRSYSATGSAGVIHASTQIQTAIDAAKQYLGEGNALSFIWNHSEGKINLLAMKDVTLKDLIGTNGRIEIDAPRAINLPVSTLATNYRIIGRDLRLDPEPFVLSGFVDKLTINPSSAVEAGPVGFIGLDDALLLYNCWCMFRDIFSLLHPSADIILPDEIAATAQVSGDTLTITFDKSPSICLKWLFTFNLVVKQVTVTTTNIHVDFGNSSRWIKSRDFAVQE